MARNRAGVFVAILIVLVMVGSSFAVIAGVGGSAASSRSPSVSVSTSSGAAGAASTSHSAASPSVSSGLPAYRLSVDQARAALVQKARQAFIDNGIPLTSFLPPNLNAAPGPVSMTDNHVVPLYDYAAAPIGISTFGLNNTSGTTSAYILNTTSLEGTFSEGTDPLGLEAISPYYGSLQSYGDQLNTVLNDTTVYGHAAYDFWLQNVITYNSATNTLSFENNIWNFSSPSGIFPSTSILHGLGRVESSEVYEEGGPSTVTNFPFTLDLYLNTTVGSYSGSPLVNEVYFNYTIINDLTNKVVCPATEPAGEVCGMYDNVYFNSKVAVTPGSAEIQANGEQYTPLGLPSDMEMDVGIGQSDGANANVVYDNSTVGLYVLNATTHTYQPPPSAYDFGSETGETGQGALTTWATVGGQPVAYERTGPSILTGLWNVTGGTDGAPTIGFEAAGAFPLNYASVAPGNAFIAIAQGSGITNQSFFQVAPTFGWYSGKGRIGQNIWLSPGTYTVEVMLSGYTQLNQTVTISSATSLSVSLTPQGTPTVYTPMWAYSNSDLANLSISGAGTSVSPYILPGAQPGSLSPVFAILNDYLFIIYSGIWVNGTTAYFQFNPAPSLEITEPTWWYFQTETLAAAYGGTLTYNHLPMYFYHTSNFVVEHGSDIGIWSSDIEVGQRFAAYCNVCSNSLFASNTFNVSSEGLELLGSGTNQHNYVWNNTFVPFSLPGEGSEVGGSAYGGMEAPSTGLVLSEGGDHVYNNAFYTNRTLTSTSASLQNYYNASGGYQSATNSIVVDGVTLSGSILGTSLQGGNYYRDYGALPNAYGVTPYVSRTSSPTSTAEIGKGGDTSPLSVLPGSCAALCRPNSGLYHLVFTESGLASGKSWTMKVFGVPVYEPALSITYTTNPTNASTTTTDGFWLPNGTYTWSVSTVPTGCGSTCQAMPNTGSVTVNGANPTGISIAFSEGFTQTITETGLPISTVWWFNVTGRVAVSGTVTASVKTISDVLPNNTTSGWVYQIHATPSWRVSAGPGTGTDVVNGATPAGISVTFGGAYGVTFSESGLPASLTWQVTLASVPMSLTTNGSTDSLTFAEPSGTFAYTIADVSGWHQSTLAYSGNVVVSGASVTEPTLVYNQISYSVTFSESGLPSGETFQVTVNGAPESLLTDGSTDSLSFAEANGTYGYAIADISGWHQTTLAYYGNVTVAGASVSETTLVYSQVTYSVTFSESGLPSGETFQVTVNGVPESLLTDGSTDTLTFSGLANGTYGYTIADVSGWHQTTLAYGGNVVVSGGTVTEPTLAYTQVTYSVTISESGLPIGQNFSVTVGGVLQYLTTDGATDSLTWTGLPNDTYAYSVADISGWHQTTLAYSGDITVIGASVTEPTLVYTAWVYSVTFAESGLPPSTSWSVILNGTNQTSSGPSIVFSEPNGTYLYHLGIVPGYGPTPSMGSVTVSGAAQSIPIAFVRGTFTVTFTETGLPGGTHWSVTLNGTTQTTTMASMAFTVPNGTYSFSIPTIAGYYISPSYGAVVVNGAPVSQAITFTQIVYTVTFTESGLRAGAQWMVALNGTEETSTGTTISFGELDGTYTYVVIGPSGYRVSAPAPEGTVIVNGASDRESVSFVRGATYTLTFHETGLRPGTSWCVTIGAPFCSTSATVSIKDLTPGTYTYSVGSFTGMTTFVKLGALSEPTSGSVTVAHSETFQVRYTYPVTFTESGLPHATSWTVTAGGIVGTSTSTTIVIDLTNGTYAFSVHAVAGYITSPASGRLTVAGGPAGVSVTFTARSHAPAQEPVGGVLNRGKALATGVARSR
jgi:hypothetical protein